jgi:hypothetical protein
VHGKQTCIWMQACCEPVIGIDVFADHIYNTGALTSKDRFQVRNVSFNIQ